MKKLFLKLGIAAAVTACITPMPVQAKGLTAISAGCINSTGQNTSTGQWVVINDRDTIKEILQNLSGKCGINLDFLFSDSCTNAPADDSCTPETPAPDQSQPVPPATETPAPDESQPVPPAAETPAPDETQPVPPAAETPAPDQTQPAPPSSDDADETETAPADTIHPYVLRILELVNEERVKAGLNPVTLDTAASNAAQIRAREIVSSFSHTRPNGSSFSTALKEQGISYRRAGENIAWGQRSPEQVMDAWMNSSGHRANILGESFTHIGIGYYQENGVNYWTQLFYQ